MPILLILAGAVRILSIYSTRISLLSRCFLSYLPQSPATVLFAFRYCYVSSLVLRDYVVVVVVVVVVFFHDLKFCLNSQEIT